MSIWRSESTVIFEWLYQWRNCVLKNELPRQMLKQLRHVAICLFWSSTNVASLLNFYDDAIMSSFAASYTHELLHNLPYSIDSASDLIKDRELCFYSYRPPADANNSIKMEVGIEYCLHIEFEYNKSRYICFFLFIYFILIFISLNKF